ncbi:MAG: hypothetical protein M3437_19410, partial [Chloroflexota bacterium]|nr:hypothetical protein [Chloroflexota bacterium]
MKNLALASGECREITLLRLLVLLNCTTDGGHGMGYGQCHTAITKQADGTIFPSCHSERSEESRP